MSGRKPVLFGGSFDPPHLGHANLIRRAAKFADAPVLIIPAAIQPLKGDVHAPALHRFALCALAFQNLPGVQLITEELSRQGKSFTVDTVRALAGQGHWSARVRPWLLLGQDSLKDMPRWRSVEALSKQVDLLVAPRPGAEEAPPLVRKLWARRLKELPGKAHRASSTAVRTRIREDRSLQGYTSAGVARYLKNHKLYLDG